jgi:hypothetical protein
VHPSWIFAARARKNQRRIHGWSVFAPALLREVLQIFIFLQQRPDLYTKEHDNIRTSSVEVAQEQSKRLT